MRLRSAVRLAAALVALSSAAAAQTERVWIVDDDGGPGVDFTDIQPAVDASAYFDRILVRSGRYDGFTIEATNLSVVADRDAHVVVAGEVRIQNQAAFGRVLLRGLRSGAGVEPLRLVCRDVIGRTWIEDCAIGPLAGDEQSLSGLPGAFVENASSVAFLRSSVRGGAGLPGRSAPPGLDVLNANAHLFDSTFTGGAGADAGDGEPVGAGGPGVRHRDYLLFAHGCTLAGGPGGDGSSACSPGGAGGAGLLVDGPFADVELRDAATVGGMGGASCGNPGASGVPQRLIAGSLTTYPAPARRLRVASPVRANELARVTVVGQPGDVAIGILSPYKAVTPYPSLQGWLLVEELGVFVVHGVVPAAGTLHHGFAPPPIAAGSGSRLVHLQLVTATAAGAVLLEPPASLLVVPAGT